MIVVLVTKRLMWQRHYLLQQTGMSDWGGDAATGALVAAGCGSDAVAVPDSDMMT